MIYLKIGALIFQNFLTKSGTKSLGSRLSGTRKIHQKVN